MRTQRFWRVIFASLCVVSSGCTVVSAASGEVGIDTSAIQLRAPRDVVEDVLGAPMRTWISSDGVECVLYEYDGGRPASIGGAVMGGILNVATAGMWELMEAAERSESLLPPRDVRRLVVTYHNQRVIGLFDEFAALPHDGKSGVRPQVLSQ